MRYDGWDLAQLNIAFPLAPVDSPVLADFVRQLDQVNGAAENANGFVWRLMLDAGEPTGVAAFDEAPVIINMSTWLSVEHLQDYVFNGIHLGVLKRRREWFDVVQMATTCLWWVPRLHKPSIAEAHERLEHLRAHGPTAQAFTFKEQFSPVD